MPSSSRPASSLIDPDVPSDWLPVDDELPLARPASAAAPRPRVVFVAVQEPNNRFSFSGAFHLMVRALVAEGFAVDVAGHELPLAIRLKRLLPFGRFHKPITRSARAIADATAASLSSSAPGAVAFAPLASEVVSLLPEGLPVVYFTDATPKLLAGGYAAMDRIGRRELERRHACERAAMGRAARLVCSSRWAAASAVRDYGASPERIVIAPYGSPLEPARADALSRRLSSPLRLLWVGADWERKGGARAVETHRALRARGLDVELHMCGARGPGCDAAGVVHHGFLDRGKRAHLRRTCSLMRRCHVFLLPTQADCSPLVLAEAAAWGMPAVTTGVGGVPEIVADGDNGLLVDARASPASFAEAVQAITTTADVYTRFVLQARSAYETRLTWRRWAAVVGRALCAADAARSPGRSSRV